jgi:hypothetical protein
MLRTAMLAIAASFTVGVMAPNDAAAQVTPLKTATTPRAGGVIVHQDPRINDGRCYDDDDRYDRDRYDHGHDKDKNKGDKYKNKDGRYGDRDCDWQSSSGSSKKGNGPPFCRSGQGHPVHGMAWCREKGWTSLRNTGWGDVILRRPRNGQQDLGSSILQDILGRTVYGRFDQQRMRLGVHSPLVGRWGDTSDGSQLNLFAGGVQIGQILDRNRDGRADLVLLNYGQ